MISWVNRMREHEAIKPWRCGAGGWSELLWSHAYEPGKGLKLEFLEANKKPLLGYWKIRGMA